LKAYLSRDPDLEVRKSVNSSFHGTPDLNTWLSAHGNRQIVITGITTNHCCETTARVGGNLGFDVLFAIDATHTFDRTGPDGRRYQAEQLAAVTAANLHDEFATVTTTAALLTAIGRS
jgi:nicotinamidase-related amidase